MILKFFITVLVGFMADLLLGTNLNWPGAGAIFAVATMGCFILSELQKEKQDKE